MLDDSKMKEFQITVSNFYREFGRHSLPWRQTESDNQFDPYKIMVSEFMLQQTQVNRVVPKYQEFIEKFPTIEQLAAASLGSVLRTWSGLGYNRRAQYLLSAVRQIRSQTQPTFPTTINQLTALPGIGPNTAAAILAYAYNMPTVFIETNIRTVIIYHFFTSSKRPISEQAVLDIVGNTLDRRQPRVWYWGLMDYGAYVKRTVGNLNMASISYAKQTPFIGSRRQLRGAVLRLLSDHPYTKRALYKTLNDDRTEEVIAMLVKEGLIIRTGQTFHL